MTQGGTHAGDRPDPTKATSAAAFVRELGRMRVLAGDTYRQLQHRTGVPHSTLGDVLTGRRRTRTDVIDKIVRAYAADDAQARLWMDAWSRLTAADHVPPEEPETAGTKAPPATEPEPEARYAIPRGAAAHPGTPPATRLIWRPRLRMIVGLCAIALIAVPLGAAAVTRGNQARGDASRAEPSPAATAAQNRLQAQIDLQLLHYPAGRQINAREISYRDGTFVMAFVPPGQTGPGRPDCPTGSVCVYAGEHYAWPRLQISSCGWQDLSWLNWHDRTRSVHNNTGSAVVALNHEDRGDPANQHRLDIRLLDIPTHSAHPVMLPATDHLQRAC